MAEQNYRVFFDEAMNQLHNEYKDEGKESEFILWFKVAYVEDTISEITVSVASEFMRQQMDLRGVTAKIQQKITELTDQQISLKYIVRNESINSLQKSSESVENYKVAEPVHVATIAEEPKQKKKHPQLDENFTFENFVPGDNSEYAYSASLAAAKNPGKSYNPILIYGGVGLGKTHLMQAIGNYIYQNSNEKKNILYVKTETMMNEFSSALRAHTTESFKKKYRNAEVLLLDDIHFIQEKYGLQEELFYTFDSLYERKCQIVFTCDRPITELKNIESRLSSRFSRGLNIDLQPPNYETRRAILEKKKELLLETNQFPSSAIHRISADILDYIAKNVQTNVRDLEACLTKMIGYAELVGKNVTIEIAQQQLRDTFSSPLSGTITVENIQKVVANHYNISISDIKSNKRSTKFVVPRQIAIYIARSLTEYSYPELGGEFGGRDHSTMMHSYEKIADAIKTDSSLDTTINQLIREVKDYKK